MKEVVIEMSNEEKSFQKTVINCLSCIYDDYHLNPYKMVVFKNLDLASFNKKRRNNYEK